MTAKRVKTTDKFVDRVKETRKRVKTTDQG